MSNGNVVPIRQEDARLTQLWAAYETAAKVAQASLRMEDGIRAGKAWGAFMREFEK